MIFNGSNKESEQNFWISYADLMAGLLFVFILLIGAIVVKYVFIQTDLQAIRTDLQREKEALGLSEEALAKKKQRIKEFKERLEAAKKENIHLAFELKQLQELQERTQNSLKLSRKEAKEYKTVLKQREAEIATKIEQISLNTVEIEKLKRLLFDYDLREKTLNELVKELRGSFNIAQAKNRELSEKFVSAQKEIERNAHVIKLRDEELAMLEAKLLEKSKAHQKLVEDLNITKVKIQNLTGIKVKVVGRLKEELGDSIGIDSKTGAMRFSSNILFNQGDYRLKEAAKKELSKILYRYISTLLLDESIRRYIDTITIEGHTNSDGDYLYNLALSQKRALAVMEFLYSLDFADEELFRKYLSASGRAFADPVLDKNGKEDKDASRRIEIKFRIKSEDAVRELESFLNRSEAADE
jgi:chemotaxis protein MotB